MQFTQKQLQRMGDAARNEFRPGIIEVEATNLNNGTTVVMKGRRPGSSSHKVEILVSANGQATDLAALTDLSLRRVS